MNAAKHPAKKAASQQPPPLAQEPRILDCFIDELARTGVVPVPVISKLLFLAVVTRFLSRPVCLLLKGPASVGKTSAVQSVLQFFSRNAYFVLTAMSEHALVYSKESFVNRILIIYEAAGLGGQVAPSLMHSLVSEGRIDYHTVVLTPKGPEGRHIVKEGPTGLFVTTVRVRLRQEDETRMFAVTLSDSREQTAAIIKVQGADRGDVADLSRWHALDAYLATSEHRVEIGFAPSLASLIPPVAVRLRRDFPAVLNLIRAHALLHQASRTRDDAGRVRATLDDYRQVRRLVEKLLSEGLGKTVSDRIRETVLAVPEEANQFDEITVTSIAEQLGIDVSTASRRVYEALSLRYLENLQVRKYGPAILRRANPLPEKFRVLPTTKQLSRAIHSGSRAVER